jgi:predicted MFS family arabinose efflux permease
MIENKFPAWVYRWRIALALCAGSLIGGISLDLLHLQSAVVNGAAAGTTAAVFLWLRK